MAERQLFAHDVRGSLGRSYLLAVSASESGVPSRSASDAVPMVPYDAVKYGGDNMKFKNISGLVIILFIRYCIAPQLRSIAGDPGEMLLSWVSTLVAIARQGHTVKHKCCRSSSRRSVTSYVRHTAE